MQTDTQVLRVSNKLKQGTRVEKDNCKDKKVRCKTLIIHGGKYRTTYSKKFENRKSWVKPDKNQIISYFPGTVNELLIREGDIVKKGDQMLTLEAMKMLNSIEVPHNGMIRKIHVKEGDKVPKGFLMIEFE